MPEIVVFVENMGERLLRRRNEDDNYDKSPTEQTKCKIYFNQTQSQEMAETAPQPDHVYVPTKQEQYDAMLEYRRKNRFCW